MRSSWDQAFNEAVVGSWAEIPVPALDALIRPISSMAPLTWGQTPAAESCGCRHRAEAGVEECILRLNMHRFSCQFHFSFGCHHPRRHLWEVLPDLRMKGWVPELSLSRLDLSNTEQGNWIHNCNID
jgi:hypothetical protein